ncbi:MAG: pantetheine-phosphate adenylyltransferase [Gemmatimonadetes bacterium]|nr:pantetheine-phosphate adenylyltransferase [Gemmatimonadota bacterium]
MRSRSADRQKGRPVTRKSASAERTVVAIYPGSFDPVTLGHEDIARRCLSFADQVIIAVTQHATHAKKPLFTVQERLEMLREVFAGEKRIACTAFDGLLVDFARERGARFVIRGLRAVSDFEYEFQMAQMNRELSADLETLFLIPDLAFSFLSASLVREVASLGGDVSRFVSQPVFRRLEKRLRA